MGRRYDLPTQPFMPPLGPPPTYYHYHPRFLTFLMLAGGLGIVLMGIGFALQQEAASAVFGISGMGFVLGVITTVCVLDGRGFVSMRGLLNWRTKQGCISVLLVFAFIGFFYVILAIYLVRTYRDLRHIQRATGPAVPGMPPQRPLGGRAIVALVSGGLVTLCLLVSSISAAAQSGPNAAAIPTSQIAQSSGHSTVSPTSNHLPIATTQPTDTPTLSPTATNTPKPTPTNTPRPQPTATNTPAPSCGYQAVNGNPWCFNFSCCTNIYSPPSNFCSYFACIGNFWNGSGYVEECSDGMYSKSGGRSGSCSYHGGNWRALLQP